MGWIPRPMTICTRCRKQRGLIHHCPSTSSRQARTRVVWRYPNCPRCKKPVKSPLSHVCRSPRGDFSRRRAEFEREQREKARAAARAEREKNGRPSHDYHSCSDAECKRATCVAFKEGRAIGTEEGWEQALQLGGVR